MLVNDTLDDNVRNEARRYFNFNFNQGTYDTAPFTVNVTKPATGTFHHVVASYDGSVLRLFIDGALGSQENDDRAAKPKDSALWIGRRADDARSIDGVIDEVAIYDKALAEDRIVAHHRAAGR